jgi:hypothetical protein
MILLTEKEKGKNVLRKCFEDPSSEREEVRELVRSKKYKVIRITKNSFLSQVPVVNEPCLAMLIRRLRLRAR